MSRPISRAGACFLGFPHTGKCLFSMAGTCRVSFIPTFQSNMESPIRPFVTLDLWG